MDGQWSRRGIMSAALAAVTIPASVNLANAQDKSGVKPAATAAASTKGKLTDQSLGTLLKAMGLEAKASEQRYDFTFKATIEDEEWELSISAVLSQDGSSIWIMAWLDELPKSAADVPRTALLRLLSNNDKLGKGKFFAYIATNRRFVLQRVIPNENITAAGFRAALDDLGQSVVATHPHWSVANWGSTTGDDPGATAKSAGPQIKGSAPQSGGVTAGKDNGKPSNKAPVSAVNDSTFSNSSKR